MKEKKKFEAEDEDEGRERETEEKKEICDLRKRNREKRQEASLTKFSSKISGCKKKIFEFY